MARVRSSAISWEYCCKGILQMLVVTLNGVDLFQGDGVEAHHVFELPAAVTQRDSHGHDVFVGVVDGLRW